MSAARKRTRNRNAGLYLVLFAVTMFAVIALAALVIGMGFITAGSTKVQQVANVAALASLKQFVENRGSLPSLPPPTIGTITAASPNVVDRANEILAMNKLLGSTSGLGGIGLTPASEGGIIRFGVWYPEDPDGGGVGSNPCDIAVNSMRERASEYQLGDYPCFVPKLTGDSASDINAVNVRLRTESGNPIVAPFTRFFGLESTSVNANATAALVQRCTAFVLDVTMTSAGESHSRPLNLQDGFNVFNNNAAAGAHPGNCDYASIEPMPGVAPARIVCPNNTALFAHGFTNNFATLTGGPPAGFQPYQNFYSYCNNATLIQNNNPDFLFWCNMSWHKGSPLDHGSLISRTPGAPLQSLDHYRQHYVAMESPHNIVYVDVESNPEPLTSYLSSFNAGLRIIKEQSTSGDKALVVPFTGRVRGRYPSTGATSNLDLLIQLTNVRNRGQRSTYSGTPLQMELVSNSVIKPNFIDMGWFPLYTPEYLDGRTHIIAALQSAIDTLKDPAVCPAQAQKSIILATDGAPNCAWKFNPGSPNTEAMIAIPWVGIGTMFDSREP
jgi:hypothetical protein